MRKLLVILSSLTLAAFVGLTALSFPHSTLAFEKVHTHAIHKQAKKHVVTIKTHSSGTFFFSPSTITIKKGSSVTWHNMTNTLHTITSNNNKFPSKNIEPKHTVTIVFKKAGTYKYHCIIHSDMKAKVVVQK